MGYNTRYLTIQSQLQQLQQVVNNVLGMPRGILAAYDEQAALEKIGVDLDIVYNLAKLELKSQHNQLSFINNVPDELLLIIFTHASNDQAERMFQYTHLTWICRRWRTLALDCADLWTHLDLRCGNYDLIQEWLSRSKLAKLWVTQEAVEFVNYDSVGHEIVMLERLIGPQLWRVESLSLTMNGSRLKDIRHFLQQEAPSLKHLHLSHANEVVPWVTSYHTAETSMLSVRLPKLFNGVSQLHSLSYDMPSTAFWDDFIPLMKDLRELRVATMSQDSGRTRERLLSILPSCPSLEILDFNSGSDGEIVAASQTIIPTVSMPKLRRLTLRSIQDVSILRHVDMPRLQDLSLYLDGGVLSESLVGFISDGFDLASLKEVSIDSHGNVSGTSAAGEYTPPCSGSRRKLLSVFSPQPDRRNPFIPALLSILPNISCLVIGSIMHGLLYVWSCNTTKEMVSGAKSVTHLVIAWPPETLHLLKILEDPAIFPNLVKVTCVRCDSPGTFLEEQLLACAQARPFSPFKEVILMDCPPLSTFSLECMNELGITVLARGRDHSWKTPRCGW